jgi:fructose-1,6-bisphosphatase/sedoheptulose 1,7-bisphosphatase-like protein
VRLIMDGDIAGVIHTADPDETGIDMYIGIGGAPEGVLAAAALRCIGGQMQTRLVLRKPEERERAERMGIADPDRKLTIEDMAAGDVMFAATGVTDGSMLPGVTLRARLDRDPHGRHALRHRHGALDQEPAQGLMSLLLAESRHVLDVSRSLSG